MRRKLLAPIVSRWRKVLGVAILALGAFSLGFLVLDLIEIQGASNGSRSTYSAVLQSFVYVVAILVGGALAVYKLQVFRDFEPHLTVSHSISHRHIGDSYWHIAVTATMRNTSKVKVEIQERVFRLQHIAPVFDSEVQKLYAEVRHSAEGEGIKEFRWPTLEEDHREWMEHEVIVEPGESDQETVDFIIGDGVRSILVHTYYYNPHFQAGTNRVQGWGATGVYDIVDRS